MQETQVWPLDQEDSLEEEMASHSSILAWEIPWTEKPGGLQSMGLQRVEHDWPHVSTQNIQRSGLTESKGWKLSRKYWAIQACGDKKGKKET